MDIKKLEDKLNDFTLNMDIYDDFIYHNIDIFYFINFKVLDLLGSDVSDFKNDIDIKNMSKISFIEILKLLKEFYKKLNINFDVDNLYNNGTIGYAFYDYEDTKQERFRMGANYHYINDSRESIIVCNNGVISDADVLVHELSHYRNNMDCKRNIITKFFTETLAYTDQFIFYDYLLQKGFKIDSNFIKQIIKFFYDNATYLLPIMEVLFLYKEFGSISKNDFEKFYETTDDYEEDLKFLDEMPDNASLMNAVSYNISILLAPYLFYKYKEEENYKFLDVFNNMIMDKNITLEECFNFLGLNSLDEDDYKILTKNMNRFKSEYIK